ncbi:hypothetical protein F9H62_01760 [Vibrio alginolyticus]|nr:hypothetical protein [Vibrio alginolyticus]
MPNTNQTTQLITPDFFQQIIDGSSPEQIESARAAMITRVELELDKYRELNPLGIRVKFAKESFVLIPTQDALKHLAMFNIYLSQVEAGLIPLCLEVLESSINGFLEALNNSAHLEVECFLSAFHTVRDLFESGVITDLEVIRNLIAVELISLEETGTE